MNALTHLARTVAVATALLAGFAAPVSAAPITGGTTVVTLDLTSQPNFVSVATGNGIGPAAIAPGTLGGDPLAFTFPITEAGLSNILHSGGIRLTQGETVLDLLNFDIDIATLILSGTGILNGNSLGSLPLFTVDGSTLALALTGDAAGALNSVFGATNPAFTAGLSVGTASFTAVPEPGSLALLGLGLAGLAFSRRRKAA